MLLEPIVQIVSVQRSELLAYYVMMVEPTTRHLTAEQLPPEDDEDDKTVLLSNVSEEVSPYKCRLILGWKQEIVHDEILQSTRSCIEFP